MWVWTLVWSRWKGEEDISNKALSFRKRTMFLLPGNHVTLWSPLW